MCVAIASFEPTAMIRSAAMAIAWAMVEAGSTVIIRPFLRIMLAGRMSGVAGDSGARTCVFAEWLPASAPMTVAPAPAMKWRRRISLFVRRPGNLFQLDLDELNFCGTGIADGASYAGVLPEILTSAQHLAAVRVAGHIFGDFATVQDDAHARSRLRNRRDRLAGFERDFPSADSLIIEHLRVSGRARAGSCREPVGLVLEQSHDDVVERRAPNIETAMTHRLFGIGRKSHIASRAPSRRCCLAAPHLVGHVAVGN